MSKRLFLVVSIAILFLLSISTAFYQSLFQQSLLGLNFLLWYKIISFVALISLLFSLIKQQKIVVLLFVFLFVSWLLTWSTWHDTLPPKSYFPLNDNSSRYRIVKENNYYGLCHTPQTGEKLCGFVGSSVYPLDKYVDQEISFTAQWRSDWGKPMCYVDPCVTFNRASVIDILDIKLATRPSVPE